MSKQTRLDDNAQIYHPRKPQTEKEKLREMSFKDKISYLVEYYKWFAIGGVAVIALIIYLIYGYFNPSPRPQFYAAIINNSIQEDVLQQCSDELADRLDLNLDRENVVLNTSFDFTVEGQYSVSMRQALATYIGNSEIDVIIAPESEFKAYAYGVAFKKLSDQLPTDIYSSLTDQFYMSDTDEDKEKNAYGIYLTDAKLFKENLYNVDDPYILGILLNAPHNDNTIEFIHYLFSKEQ